MAVGRRFLVPVGLHVSTSDPDSGADGEVYFNSSTNELKVYYNGVWNSISASGGGSGTVTESGTQLSTSWWLGA